MLRRFAQLLLFGLLLSLVACGSPTPSSSSAIYVSLFAATGGSRSMLAFDAKTGQERWHYDSSVLLGPMFYTPGALYTGGTDHRLYAISTKDGSRLWSYSLQGVPYVAGASNGAVYVSVTGIFSVQGTPPDVVSALNAKDGSLKWRAQVEGSFVASSDDTVYVGAADGHLYALRASDGSVRWQFQLDGTVAVARVQDGQVLVLAQTHGQQQTGTFYVLNANDGSVQWRYPEAQTKPSLSWLADGNETVYLAESPTVQAQTIQIVSALKISDGSVRWSKQMDQPSRGSEADGVLYLGSTNGMLYALNATDGSQRWQAASEDGAPWAVAGVQVASGLVYVARDRGGVSVLKASDGSVSWHYKVDDHEDGFVTVAGIQDSIVCFNSIFASMSSLEVVRATDGGSLWEHDFPAGTYPEVVTG